MTAFILKCIRLLVHRFNVVPCSNDTVENLGQKQGLKTFRNSGVLSRCNTVARFVTISIWPPRSPPIMVLLRWRGSLSKFERNCCLFVSSFLFVIFPIEESAMEDCSLSGTELLALQESQHSPGERAVKCLRGCPRLLVIFGAILGVCAPNTFSTCLLLQKKD